MARCRKTCSRRPAHFPAVFANHAYCWPVAATLRQELPLRLAMLLPTAATATNRTACLGNLAQPRGNPDVADLDQPRSLKRLRGLATHVIYLAPPADSKPTEFYTDARLNGFLGSPAEWRQSSTAPIYIGTSGVYGEIAKARWFGSLGHANPNSSWSTPRRRRSNLAALGPHANWRGPYNRSSQPGQERPPTVCILRVPGIYAGDRLPVERLRAGTPALRTEEDTWTNHIHADDLARISWLSLSRSRSPALTTPVIAARLKATGLMPWPMPMACQSQNA